MSALFKNSVGSSLFSLNSLLILGCCLALPCSSPLTASAQSQSEDVQWTAVAPSLEIGVAELSSGLFPGEITLLRSDLKKLRPRVVPAKSLGRNRGNTEWFAKKTGASLCVNGNFFGKDGKALGLVVSKGVKHHPIQMGGALLTGLFLVSRDKLAIVPREDKREEFGLEALQGGPRLIASGKPIVNDLVSNSQSRRSGICLTSDTEFIIFVASSTLRGATLPELAQVLSLPSVGCQDALNLDGGGSTQLYVSAELEGAMADFNGINVAGRDDVPTALCLFPPPNPSPG